MKKVIIAFVLAFIVTGALAAYFYSDEDVITSGDLEDVNLKLKFFHQAQFAGNYVAKEKGFYADEGLDVKLIPYSPEKPPVQSVVNGEAKFGITGAEEIILNRAKGVPIKAFAVIYKINPVVAYSLKGSGIVKPQDFVGKTVGIERNADGTDINVGYLYYAIMSKLDIDRSKINEVTIGFTAEELLNGQTDVSTGYIINEPYGVVEELGEVNTILMADYGVNMYADVLFATEDTLENEQELVQRFLSATIKGWEYALQNQSETVDHVMKYAEDTSRGHQEYMLRKSLPLIHTGNSPLGVMREHRWEQAHNILLEQEILDSPINFKEAYTNEFIERYYENKSQIRQ